MTKRRSQLNKEELEQVKSLIGDAQTGDVTLEDILAEYGVPVETPEPRPEPEPELDLPWPEAKPTGRMEDNIVVFPGVSVKPEEESRSPESEREEETDLSEEDGEKVVDFPEEESVLTAFFKDVGRMGDAYAERMFQEDEQTDPEQVRRLERLIPGTDREEELPPEDRPRRPRRTDPPPEDRPPQELAKEYARGLKGMRLRSVFVFLLAALAVAQLLIPAAGLVWPAGLGEPLIQNWAAVALCALGTLLSGDVLLGGVRRMFRGKVGMDSLAFCSALFTLLDGVLLALQPQTGGRLPYTAVVLVGQWCLLHGTYHKKCGLRLSCRTAAASANPYRITLDEGKWNGRDTYIKWAGTAQGFGSQIQSDDGVQRVFRRVCPLLLVACAALSLVATVAVGRTENLPWALSALFSAAASFGGALAYGRSFHKISRRLAQCGAALAGWPGVAGAGKGDRVLITDTDLFPPGYVEMNGYKTMGGFPTERMVAYTATVIRASGSGLSKIFQDQLRALGGMMRNAEQLHCHEGGGLSARIRGDRVLVGSADFMNLMDIELPTGLHVNNAVFCAINGELAGIFALNYTLHDNVFPSLDQLLQGRVGPVLATRDFNLIPSMLQRRFKLAANKMDFPPIERRRELSDPEQSHSDTLTALLCREGLYPFAEAITAARQLRRTARLGAVLCSLGSLLGVMLTAYLVSAQAFGSLSELNLLIYMLTWLLPIWFLSGWAHRF